MADDEGAASAASAAAAAAVAVPVTVTVAKSKDGVLGLVLGGGAPYCPCMYVTAITRPEAFPPELECGDEIIDLNGEVLIGKSREEVSGLISAAPAQVRLTYKKLPEEAPLKLKRYQLEVGIRKLKQKFADKLSQRTLDALGVHRAALDESETDAFTQHINQFSKTNAIYENMVEHAKFFIKQFKAVADLQRDIGVCLSDMGVHETDGALNATLTKTSETHLKMTDAANKLFPNIEPIVDQLDTFLSKAIPDAKLTLNKYEDAKSLYLAYCLKIHQMAEKEAEAQRKDEALSRMQSGNFEYRRTLRDCMAAKGEYARLRQVLHEKLEILDTKHVTDLCNQLTAFVGHIGNFFESAATTAMTNDEAIAGISNKALEKCSALDFLDQK